MDRSGPKGTRSEGYKRMNQISEEREKERERLKREPQIGRG